MACLEYLLLAVEIATLAQPSSVVMVIDKKAHIVQLFRIDMLGPLRIEQSNVGHILIV